MKLDQIRFFLLKHLTQKVFDDSIYDAFFNVILEWFFFSRNFRQKMVFCQKTEFFANFQNTGTPLTFSDSSENWFLD